MEKTFFDQQIRSNIRTCKNIKKTTIGQIDEYKIGYLLGYFYFK